MPMCRKKKVEYFVRNRVRGIAPTLLFNTPFYFVKTNFELDTGELSPIRGFSGFTYCPFLIVGDHLPLNSVNPSNGIKQGEGEGRRVVFGRACVCKCIGMLFAHRKFTHLVLPLNVVNCPKPIGKLWTICQSFFFILRNKFTQQQYNT